MPTRNSRIRIVVTAVILGVSTIGATVPAHARSMECGGAPATIIGTPGADSIDGTSGNDVIVGLGGDDTIRGLRGDDVICGGSGDDVVRAGPGSDAIYGGSGNDILRSGPGHDGGLDGGAGNDRLYGETGGRTDYVPGPGDDLVVGSGTGADWVHLEDARGPIHASLTTGISTGQGTDRLVGVSALLGGPYDDILIGSSGDDQLVGEGGHDLLVGKGGNDTLSGMQADDTYQGGPGFDVAEYYDQAAAAGVEIGPMNVNLRTGIATGDGTDTLHSIEGATGSDKADTMIGDGRANAFFWLFGGHDTVMAGGGNDFVESSAGANSLSGGAGRDMVAYLDGADPDHQHHAVTVNLVAGTTSSGDTLSGFEDVRGSPQNDTLIGDGGSNQLFGWLGDDVLEGGAGNDRLAGNQGTDRADGGVGADRCWAEVRMNCESGNRTPGPAVSAGWCQMTATPRSGNGVPLSDFRHLCGLRRPGARALSALGSSLGPLRPGG